MRWFGRYTLEVQMMGVDSAHLGRAIVVPFADLERIAGLAPQIIQFDLPEHFSRVSPKSMRRRIVRWTVWVVLATALASVWLPDAAWALALLPLFYLMTFIQYRCHGYAVEGDAAFVRRGFWAQRLWIIPIGKLQIIWRSQSIFQRMLGLATLHIDIAGGQTFTYAKIIDAESADVDALMNQLYGRFAERRRDRARER
jgi:putative membrane protein